VAHALSEGRAETLSVSGVPVFSLEGVDGKRYVVCAALGHLYGLSETVRDRTVYPALDLEWFPLGAVRKSPGNTGSRIKAIASLSEGASEFVNACDLDAEGETIGYNILRYACGGKEVDASRARFSALTSDDVARAFRERAKGLAGGLAVAGRLRHMVDFVWGVNLTRALSESFRTGHGRFRTVSMGRVQGPTLRFVVDKEVQAQTFVPTPYWKVAGAFRKGGKVFDAEHSPPHLSRRSAAEDVRRACQGRQGVVSRIATERVIRRPPPPFNLGDLQRESFARFGMTPKRTLQAAERLYLGAKISYPRTSSQRLPKIEFRGLLRRLAVIPEYSSLVAELVSRVRLRPSEGREVDPAHPAIYPTGERGDGGETTDEGKVLDLVVRRFLACFGDDAVDEKKSIEISVGDHEFITERRRNLVSGWTKFVHLGSGGEGTVALPQVEEGDIVTVEEVDVSERFRERPTRYNQATLLEKMQAEGIGTKATRADVISTLVARGYAVGAKSLTPTELGLALVDSMLEYCPQIVSTGLTRELEDRLERVESSPDSKGEVFDETLKSLSAQIRLVRQHERDIADRIAGSLREAAPPAVELGGCPVCKEGRLVVVRSRKSGKRFVGCTHYPQGCVASAPLPQKGALKPTPSPCASCGWPVAQIRFGRRSWKLCVNDRCPRKVNVYSMQKITVPRVSKELRAQRNPLGGQARVPFDKTVGRVPRGRDKGQADQDGW